MSILTVGRLQEFHYSRMTWVFMMKQKSEAFKIFKHQITFMKNQIEKPVKCFTTNSGLEFCRDEGIATQRTIWYTPQQNRVAEKMNMTLLERVRCMLSNSGFNRSFWTAAINMTCYLVNHLLSTTIDFKTLIEVQSNKPVEY